MIKLTLPLPPSVNSYQPHTSRGGRCVRYLSAKAKLFKYEVTRIVMKENAALMVESRLKLSIVIHPRDKRKIDLDNRIKPIQDALQDAGVFKDDCQIDKLVVKRGNIVKNGKAIIEIELVGDK